MALIKYKDSGIVRGLLWTIGTALWAWPWIDYFDLGLWSGINIFHYERDLESVVTWFVGLPVIATFIYTVATFHEQQRQRELDTRPYLRMAWDSTFIGENRLRQGITDSCFIAVNEGKGHMRNVTYNAEVGGKTVALRRHELIRAGGQTIIVYDDTANQSGPALGNRNDIHFEPENFRIIAEENVEIWGTYKDLTGKATYQFKFISDVKSQSGLSEPYSQDRVS